MIKNSGLFQHLHVCPISGLVRSCAVKTHNSATIRTPEKKRKVLPGPRALSQLSFHLIITFISFYKSSIYSIQIFKNIYFIFMVYYVSRTVHISVDDDNDDICRAGHGQVSEFNSLQERADAPVWRPQNSPRVSVTPFVIPPLRTILLFARTFHFNQTVHTTLTTTLITPPPKKNSRPP